MRRFIYFLLTIVMTFYYSSAAVLAENGTIRAIDPGVLFAFETAVDYEAKPAILTGPASGGSCSPTTYQYEWQQSVNGRPWEAFGTGEPCPSNAPGIIANTQIRRKVTCGAEVAYTNVLNFTMIGMSPDNINYVRVNDVWKPGITAVTGVEALAIGDKQRSTTYFDGMGRPIQVVKQQGSGSKKDLVQYQAYDTLGREVYKYLPYTYQNSNTDAFSSNGQFKMTGVYEQADFNQTLFPNEPAYGKIDYEQAPLHRILKSMPPGTAWAGSNRGTESENALNIVSDSVVIWKIGGAGATPVKAGFYGLGQLFKVTAKDEQGNREITFKDKNDRTILKKVEFISGAATGHWNWLCTYYVYDDFDQLRYVIPPKAVDIMLTNSWNIADATLRNELCFQYEYDKSGRMISKKVPGAAVVEMVYDGRDRLVFIRDGNLKDNGNWLVTFYDALNRATMTALYRSAATRDALQTSLDAVADNNRDISFSFPGPADLLIRSYDGSLLYEASNSITVENGFDSGNADGLELRITPGLSQGTTTLRANNPLPSINPADLTALTYTYYDNYNFPGSQAVVTQEFTMPQASTNPNPEAVAVVNNMQRNLVTGAKVRIIGSDQWLTTTNYYNAKGRLVQSISDNISGSKDILTNLYDFSGKLLSNYRRHRNQRSSLIPEIGVLTQMSYDQAGRLLFIDKGIVVNGVTSIQRLVAHEYDNLGQLENKILGNNLEELQYDYNIRGWLMGMNRGYLSDPNNTSNHFGFELAYEKTTSSVTGINYAMPQYNGNITGTIWRSRGDGVKRKYDFSYDKSNRLLKADFVQSTSTPWNSAAADFSIKVGDGADPRSAYDGNGNIRRLWQRGLKGTVPSLIDDLKYEPLNIYSNKLKYVKDDANDETSQLGDFKEPAANNAANATGTPDYAYDANGNLTKDDNKKIGQISYGHSNLPRLITFTGKGSVQYVYNAAGDKLRKIVTDNTGTTAKTTVTDYIDGFVYQNDTLRFFNNEEGRARPLIINGQPLRFAYDYFIKDHLGNVRVVLTDQSGDLSLYAATMEMERAATENALFSNIDATRTTKPVGYPQTQATSKNEFVAKLNASDGGKKVGPSLVLRVMAGDTVQIGARTFYKSTGPKEKNAVTPEDMVASLLLAFGGTQAPAAAHGTERLNQVSPFGNFTGNDYQRMKEKDPDQNQRDKPKAYLNFALFDDQLLLVEENSGVKQVKGEPDQLQQLTQDKMVIKKNGLLYVYTTNETQQDVFFDDVTVALIQGPLLEETHYYPFGLTMSGISSRVIDRLGNLNGFTGKEKQEEEFSDKSGLEWIDFGARMYDPQIGRWMVPDAMADKSFAWTPYRYAFDNPLRFIDPDGNSETVFDLIQKAWDATPNDGSNSFVVQNGQVQQDPRAAKLRARYQEMIQSARKKGKNFAADNLQYFLDGKGGVRNVPLSTLTKFGDFNASVNKNQERFRKQILDIAYKLKDGETRVIQDHWDAVVDASVFSELYYASGKSQISSKGRITVTRKGDQVIIGGTVHHIWKDPYNWNAGMSAYVPGFGDISDDDGAYLEENGNAKSYNLRSSWDTNVTGKIVIRPYWFDGVDINWKNQ